VRHSGITPSQNKKRIPEKTMKLQNTKIAKGKSGMTLLELTVVILVLLALISILFVGARAWKKGSDRAANLMNLRNCQQAMRGHQNMRQLNAGADFDQAALEEYIKFPSDIGTAVTYTAGTVITDLPAEPPTDDTHIWLRPSAAGLPTGEYGHESLAEVAGW
jgi:type II secretory pathway pseudopilin PulG